jgi:hypothetical protein
VTSGTHPVTNLGEMMRHDGGLVGNEYSNEKSTIISGFSPLNFFVKLSRSY